VQAKGPGDCFSYHLAPQEMAKPLARADRAAYIISRADRIVDAAPSGMSATLFREARFFNRRHFRPAHALADEHGRSMESKADKAGNIERDLANIMSGWQVS
jgi:hypothetical protein